LIDKLEQAREVVRRYPLTDALRRLSKEEDGLTYYDGVNTVYLESKLTSDVLAQSLHYMIKLKLTSISDESDVPLGVSKYKGLPHLPPSLTWPSKHYFLAQFNLAELHSLDLHGAFPDSGMFYFFFNPGGEVTVTHYDGPLDRLQLVPYPDSAHKFNGSKYYLDGFRRRSSLIRFRPRGAFYIGSGYGLSSAKKLIPRELREQVATILGGRVASWDSDCRIFGRPLYWQGEDERLDDDDDPQEPRHLLLQDEFGEGHIHIWIDAVDARRRDYSECWMDYSGT